MNYCTKFSINAFISVLLGLGFLILPGIILDHLGLDTYAGTKRISDFFGIALLVGAAAGLIHGADLRYFALKLVACLAYLYKFGCGKHILGVPQWHRCRRFSCRFITQLSVQTIGVTFAGTWRHELDKQI